MTIDGEFLGGLFVLFCFFFVVFRCFSIVAREYGDRGEIITVFGRLW